jgi:hypothetical protein
MRHPSPRRVRLAARPRDAPAQPAWSQPRRPRWLAMPDLTADAVIGAELHALVSGELITKARIIMCNYVHD